MKTGAAYIRVSTDDQLEFSPDSQLHKIRDFAKSNGIILPEEFVFMEEEGRSGRNAKKRPQFQRMIGMSKSTPKPFEVILVWKFSRFARNREDSVVYKSMLRKQCGIDVISVSENVGDDKMSILIEAIIEAMDEWYSVNLGEEVIRGMTEKASRGGVVGSPAYGYTMKDGIFFPIPEQAAIVKMVFEKFAYADMGCRDLATMLNSMGVRSKKGRLMENRTVEYMLRNPVYIGKIRWSKSGQLDRNWEKNEDVILSDGQHEPIVSKELFDQAQEKLAERKIKYAKYARQSVTDDIFMLKGIVRCSDCGSTLVRSSAKGGLQCHSYAHGACSTSHYISFARANERIIDLIEQSADSGEFELIIKAVPMQADSADVARMQIDRERAKLDRVKEAYASGIDTLEEYKMNKTTILETIASLEKQQPPKVDAKKKKAEFLQNVKVSIKELRNPERTEAYKNNILRGFVDHIIFDRTKNKFSAYFYTL